MQGLRLLMASMKYDFIFEKTFLLLVEAATAQRITVGSRSSATQSSGCPANISTGSARFEPLDLSQPTNPCGRGRFSRIESASPLATLNRGVEIYLRLFRPDFLAARPFLPSPIFLASAVRWAE